MQIQFWMWEPTATTREEKQEIGRLFFPPLALQFFMVLKHDSLRCVLGRSPLHSSITELSIEV